MALTDKLVAIADAIRGKTGKTEEMTLEQMATAIAGIETGGGGGLAYDMGEFVLDADVQVSDAGVPHSLGDTPGFVLVWTDAFSDLTSDNPSPYTTTTTVGYIWIDNPWGLSQRLTSAVSTTYAVGTGMTIGGSSYVVGIVSPSSASYGFNSEYMPTAETIPLTRFGNNHFWRAGVTHKYFVSKAWWNVGGVASAE